MLTKFSELDEKDYYKKPMLLTILVRLVDLYSTLIVVYVLFSWIPQKSGILYDIDSVLRRICEP